MYLLADYLTALTLENLRLPPTRHRFKPHVAGTLRQACPSRSVPLQSPRQAPQSGFWCQTKCSKLLQISDPSFFPPLLLLKCQAAMQTPAGHHLASQELLNTNQDRVDLGFDPELSPVLLKNLSQIINKQSKKPRTPLRYSLCNDWTHFLGPRLPPCAKKGT